MGKHKKHKKHHSHTHTDGFKEPKPMRVVVPLHSLEGETESAPVITPQRLPQELTVSIPRTVFSPAAPPQHTEHKHHKKHKKVKKHKKHYHEDPESKDDFPHPTVQKVPPLRLPVPKTISSLETHSIAPAPVSMETDTHVHKHSKHKHKHHHKRSRPSDVNEVNEQGITDPQSFTQSELSLPKAKRPKVGTLHLEESWPVEKDKREVTPLQIQLPPDVSRESHKHKKKKKKHKHSKTDEDFTWEVMDKAPPATLPVDAHTPIKADPPLTSKATPPKIEDRPPVQPSPGKQMRLMKGFEVALRSKVDSSVSSEDTKKIKTKLKSPSTPQKEKQPVVVEATKLTPPLPPQVKTPQVKLSENALKFFLKNLLHLIQKRDSESVFGEPVTDDIAPNYTTIITEPMDLLTMANKVENNQYPSVNEFKNDFVLMCTNAMTYNAPETAYYTIAKHLLNTGLQIIAKETSLRPDILHGKLASAIDRGQSSSPLPPMVTEFRLPPATTVQMDHSSPFLCRLDLSKLYVRPGLVSHSPLLDDYLNIDISGVGEIKDQSHLTKFTVGVECEGGGGVEVGMGEVLAQVTEAADSVKENLDTNKPGTKFCFVNKDSTGRTMLNILDPDTCQVDSSKPVDLTDLSNKVRMGNNAATVLKTELPMMKATPVSYLMYGPFGSFAPAYDSVFASLSKMDSDLLLSTYGSELGVSYTHSLQQFVKGSGSFVTEMAEAVLNGLTNNRHSKFVDKLKGDSSKENKQTEEENIKKEKEPDSKEVSPPVESPPITTPSPQATMQGPDESLQVDPHSTSPLSNTESIKSTPSLEGSLSGQDSPDDGSTGLSSMAITPMTDRSSRASSNCESVEEMRHSGDSHVSPDVTSNSDIVDARLQRTSDLLAELQEQQNNRLSLPPERTTDQVLLPGPTQTELDTAAQVRGELATLTAQVRPSDVVTVPSLHKAMGITIQESEVSMDIDNSSSKHPTN